MSSADEVARIAAGRRMSAPEQAVANPDLRPRACRVSLTYDQAAYLCEILRDLTEIEADNTLPPAIYGKVRDAAARSAAHAYTAALAKELGAPVRQGRKSPRGSVLR